MAGIIKRPPRPVPGWDVREWRVGIIMSGRYQAAVLVSAGPEPTTYVYLQRVGVQRSPMAIMPGTSVIICAGAPEAIALAREAGFAASLDPEQIAVWEQQL